MAWSGGVGAAELTGRWLCTVLQIRQDRALAQLLDVYAPELKAALKDAGYARADVLDQLNGRSAIDAARPSPGSP
jgi:hypothetical protein